MRKLVQYFIDDHTDQFKTEKFFDTGDIILDPFSGSGTTLVQANELGMHAIGVDVSQFNCMIAEVKLLNYDIEQLEKIIKDIKVKKILAVILSRAIRSCRATTHSDLATLKNPQISTYYCFKHKKICKPIFSIKDMFARYATDTVQRIKEYSRLKKKVYYSVLPNDSRTVDINKEVKKRSEKFYDVLIKNKIRGIFSSPPYAGQIDYHEQHAYAYDLMGFERKDELEIGPLYKGQGIEARKSYVDGISEVLLNCRKFLANDFNVFLYDLSDEDLAKPFQYALFTKKGYLVKGFIHGCETALGNWHESIAKIIAKENLYEQ